MTARSRAAGWLLLAWVAAAMGTVRADEASGAAARVEARSAELVVVGLARGDRLTLHVSRVLDNAPVRDATVTVTLRGRTYPAVADVDGGYSLQAGELAVPGSTAVEFRVVAAGNEQRLLGTLQVASPAGQADEGAGGTARQVAWWILNFGACGAFLVLLARRNRRKKAAEGADE